MERLFLPSILFFWLLVFRLTIHTISISSCLISARQLGHLGYWSSLSNSVFFFSYKPSRPSVTQGYDRRQNARNILNHWPSSSSRQSRVAQFHLDLLFPHSLILSLPFFRMVRFIPVGSLLLDDPSHGSLKVETGNPHTHNNKKKHK